MVSSPSFVLSNKANLWTEVSVLSSIRIDNWLLAGEVITNYFISLHWRINIRFEKIIRWWTNLHEQLLPVHLIQFLGLRQWKRFLTWRIVKCIDALVWLKIGQQVWDLIHRKSEVSANFKYSNRIFLKQWCSALSIDYWLNIQVRWPELEPFHF